MLAPPVNTCYECQQRLVTNHQCQVKMSRLFAPQHNGEQMLAPPVNTCYECQQRLVTNHQCSLA